MSVNLTKRNPRFKFQKGDRVRVINCDYRIGTVCMVGDATIHGYGIQYNVKLDSFKDINGLQQWSICVPEQQLELVKPKGFDLWRLELETKAAMLPGVGTVFPTLKKATKGYARYLRDFYGKEN